MCKLRASQTDWRPSRPYRRRWLKTAFCVISIAIGFCASIVHSKSLAGSYLAGSNAAMRGDYVAASKYFAETLLLDPQNQFIKYNAMLSNLSMGDVRTATNYAKEITSNSNNNQLADLLIFSDHIKNERYGLAHKTLKRNHYIGSRTKSFCRATNHVSQIAAR